ncbi:MAG: septum formation initiator family protein [Patescibacteria group bacterium]|jgi:cell division protein FtsB
MLKFKNILHSKLFTAVTLIGIVVLAIGMVKEILRQIDIKQQVTTLEQQIGELQQHNTELSETLQYFNSSLFQEKQMKERLGLQSSGETVVMIPNAEQLVAGNIQVLPDTPSVVVPNIIKWRKYFFNY